MISGPGVLSASPSPVTIWLVVSHPYCTTAAWFMYASTAYAPPNVTTAAFEKNHAICESVESRPNAAVTANSGRNQTARPTTSTMKLRLSFTRVCAPAEP